MAYKLSPEDEKEAIEFITRFVGGTQSALIHDLLIWYNSTYQAGQPVFPFNRLDPHLPQWSDIIVGGISVGEVLLGLGMEEDPLKFMEKMDYKAKEQTKEFAKGLRKFGEGAVLYSVPRLAQETIVTNVPAKPLEASPAGMEQPPTHRERVIKL